MHTVINSKYYNYRSVENEKKAFIFSKGTNPSVAWKSDCSPTVKFASASFSSVFQLRASGDFQ